MVEQPLGRTRSAVRLRVTSRADDTSTAGSGRYPWHIYHMDTCRKGLPRCRYFNSNRAHLTTITWAPLTVKELCLFVLLLYAMLLDVPLVQIVSASFRSRVGQLAWRPQPAKLFAEAPRQHSLLQDAPHTTIVTSGCENTSSLSV